MRNRAAPRLTRFATGAALAAVLVVGMTGCGAPSTTPGGTPSSAKAYTPVTVDSCGRKVVFDAPPKRILAFGTEAPSLLVAAGVGDKITHFAGTYEVPYDAKTKAAVKDAELVVKDSHDLSAEQIVATGVDVAIGTDIGAGVDIDSLAARLDKAGIKLLTVTGYCAGIEGRSTKGLSGFEMIYRDIETYGQVFGTEKVAAASVKGLKDRVSVASKKAAGARQAKRTAVPLYVTNGGPLGSYGGLSLVSEQFELLGLHNVFADVSKRYFEPSTEALVKSDPDLVVAIYLSIGSKGISTAEGVIAELRGRPEISGVAAIGNDATLLPLLYPYTSPGPLAVDGLELMADWLVKQQ